MAAYKWRRRPTRNFGEIWIPLAHIELQAADAAWQGFALQIDSGAVISLLRKSVADLLGIELQAGRCIDLTSVGGGVTTAYVHELPTRFDPFSLVSIPYAIADSEAVPNLLGRAGVFDLFDIHFDPVALETRLSRPGLDLD